jgi:hypothetical protein
LVDTYTVQTEKLNCKYDYLKVKITQTVINLRKQIYEVGTYRPLNIPEVRSGDQTHTLDIPER